MQKRLLLYVMLFLAVFGCSKNGNGPEEPLMLSFSGVQAVNIVDQENGVINKLGRVIQVQEKRLQFSSQDLSVDYVAEIINDNGDIKLRVKGKEIAGVSAVAVEQSVKNLRGRVESFGTQNRAYYFQVRYFHFTGCRLAYTYNLVGNPRGPISADVLSNDGETIRYKDVNGLVWRAKVLYTGTMELYRDGIDDKPFPGIFVAETDERGRVTKFDDQSNFGGLLAHTFAY